jgi:hypothetical protein
MFEREEEIGLCLLLGLIPLKQAIRSYFKADIDTVTYNQPASQEASKQASKQARDVLLQ